MNKKIGIWLDGDHALVVTLKENEHELKKISSDISWRERTPGEGKEYGRFGDQYLSLENKKENRLNEQKSQYLKVLLEEVKQADEVLIFGPAEMKKELENMVKKDHIAAPKLKAVKTADSITENQIVAFVREYYSE